MSDDTLRSVDIERISAGRYLARNARGGSIRIGGGGDDDGFTPVELLLVALGGCSAVDVDMATSRRTEPDEFRVRVTGDKIQDGSGNRMDNLRIEFTATFPAGEAGDAARQVLPRAARISHDRLCTVSRTVERGSPVTIVITSDTVGPDAATG
jgi:putative redox protein